jgi:hypothetical protein
MKGLQSMFKKIVLIAIVLTIALTVNFAGLLPTDNHAVDGSADTILAARFDFTQVAILADPDCPTPTSGTGGGC